MKDVLEIVFRSFWHFVGSLFLLSVVVEGIVNTVRVFKPRRK